jgi:hypothetical protein
MLMPSNGIGYVVGGTRGNNGDDENAFYFVGGTWAGADEDQTVLYMPPWRKSMSGPR